MDHSAEMLHVTKVNETFLRDFIQIYRENRILWDKTHPNYKSRIHRDAALDALVDKSMQYFPEANLDFVKTKIDSMRGTFRREYKKVQDSKKKSQDVYVPTLWYYNLLLFIAGEDEVKLEPNVNDPVGQTLFTS